jgi:hypothetical protein
MEPSGNEYSSCRVKFCLDNEASIKEEKCATYILIFQTGILFKSRGENLSKG